MVLNLIKILLFKFIWQTYQHNPVHSQHYNISSQVGSQQFQIRLLDDNGYPRHLDIRQVSQKNYTYWL